MSIQAEQIQSRAASSARSTTSGASSTSAFKTGAAGNEDTVAPGGGARLNADGSVHIAHLTVRSGSVASEACHWTSGSRGEPLPLDTAAGSDMTSFVRAAISIGSHMLAYATDATVTGLAAQVTQIAERAETASAQLVHSASQAAAQATAAATAAARHASEAATLAVRETVQMFEADAARALDARVALVGQRLDALLAGENSDLASGVRNVISSALVETQATWQASAAATLTQMQQVFDPSNPANPIAEATRAIEAVQVRQHIELTARIDRVGELVAAATGAAASAAALAAATEASPAKGLPFEEAVATALEGVAAGLGAAYERTGATVGLLRNCKKGDGIFELPTGRDGDPAPRVVIEISTQEGGRDWTAYLREAERNRGCTVSLGVVRSANQLPGSVPLVLLGATRAVVAFDPDTDSPALIRAALQLMVVEARRRLAGSGGNVLVADGKIQAAHEQLAQLISLHKLATGVRDNAGKVVSGLDATHGALSQSLEQALAALRASGPAVAGDE